MSILLFVKEGAALILILVFGINFVLYCCLRIASKEDEMLEWEASKEKKVE